MPLLVSFTPFAVFSTSSNGVVRTSVTAPAAILLPAQAITAAFLPPFEAAFFAFLPPFEAAFFAFLPPAHNVAAMAVIPRLV